MFRTMMHNVGSFAVSGLMVLGSTAQALSSTTPAGLAFCDMGVIEKEQELAHSKLPDETRFHEMDRLISEIGILKRKNSHENGIPSGFIKNCLEKKRATFTEQGQSAAITGAGRFRYHFLIGKYLEQEGNLKEALDHFARASEADKNDFSAPYRAYLLQFQIQERRFQMMRKNPGASTRRDVDDGVKDINLFLSRIVHNPKAPAPLKAEALQRHAELMDSLGRNSESLADWRQILSVDPNHMIALGKMADFELARGRSIEARKLMERLAPQVPENPTLQKVLIDLQLDTDDPHAALKTVREAIKNIPKDAEIQSLYARALALNDRLKEAEKISARALKTNPKSAIARKTAAYIHVLKGEAWAKQKIPGQALAEFQAALALDPEDKKLRTRMGILIFEQRQALNFQPEKPTRIDLDQTLKLLQPVLEANFVEQRTVEAYISAAARSSSPEKGAVACDRYTKEFGSYPSIALILDCAQNYKAADKVATARKILEDALGDSRFRGSTRDIASALTDMR